MSSWEQELKRSKTPRQRTGVYSHQPQRREVYSVYEHFILYYLNICKANGSYSIRTDTHTICSLSGGRRLNDRIEHNYSVSVQFLLSGLGYFNEAGRGYDGICPCVIFAVFTQYQKFITRQWHQHLPLFPLTCQQQKVEAAFCS